VRRFHGEAHADSKLLGPLDRVRHGLHRRIPTGAIVAVEDACRSALAHDLQTWVRIGASLADTRDQACQHLHPMRRHAEQVGLGHHLCFDFSNGGRYANRRQRLADESDQSFVFDSDFVWHVGSSFQFSG